MRAGRVLLALLLIAILLLVAWFWVTQPVRASPRPVANGAGASPIRLAARVRRLAEDLVPRDFTHVENLDRAAAYITGELEAAGAKVTEQPFSIEGRVYRNVLGAFGPETPERIVVGAHYDTDGPLPGADDNASGIAGLIELAALLAPAKLPLRVELAAYSLEEMPFFGSAEMGSAVHARSLREAGARLRAMICLEMIGYFSAARGSQAFPLSALKLFYPDTGDFIAVVGRLRDAGLVRRVKRAMRSASELSVHSINAPRSLPGVDLSDHASYWNAGYPAVMVTDTAFYRNERYHTAEDTPATLDYERMAKVVEGVAGAVRDLAGE